LQPLDGWAQVAGNEARSPRIQVRNRSAQTIKYVELGWLVSDPGGQQYLAASLPASDPALYLPAGKTARVEQDTALRSPAPASQSAFRRGGLRQPRAVRRRKLWVPSRADLERDSLSKCSRLRPKSSA